jgi:hypothetical protein
MSTRNNSSYKKSYFASKQIELSNEDQLEIRKMCGIRTSSIHNMIDRTARQLYATKRRKYVK